MDLQKECPVDVPLMQRMDRMFYPETIAVLGASRNPQKWGHRVVHSILAGGFPGRVVPVNPKGGEILGLRAVTDLAEIEGQVDLAVLVVPPEAVLAALERCIRREVGAIFVITAGFSEMDPAMLETERKMAERVRGAGIPMGGPNGQGLICTQSAMCAQMYTVMPPTGNISLITQSGNIGVTMAHLSVYHNVGISKTVSGGNEALLTTAHYLDYLAADADTSVVTVYLEGADNGRHLLAALLRTSLRKPVVILKSGYTSEGAAAAVSHTGALSGKDRIYEGVFRQGGAVRVTGLEEMFDTAAAFATHPLPLGNRVGVVTVGGGWGVLAADAAASEGLELAPLPAEIKARLDRLLPDRWSRGNPVDFAAGEGTDTRVRTLRMLLEADGFDSVVLLGAGHTGLAAHFLETSAMGGDPTIQTGAKAIKELDLERAVMGSDLARRHRKPLVVASDAVVSARTFGNDALLALRDRGEYVYPSPDRAMRALGHLTRYSAWRKKMQ